MIAIATLFQRQVAQEVDHVARIEAINYTGVSVVRVFLHDGASTALAATELASSALAVLKYMPRNITPPSILPYSATDVPIIQLSLSSNSLSDTALNDLGRKHHPAQSRRGPWRVGALRPMAASRGSSWPISTRTPFSRAG